ncbi:MAG: hypothetical protein GOVbin7368_17 [Prokaryotic dsDNA virus sp.]|nr:MAG: hypothetical protein GOVbin7368_17 [Prokaryotic dsDNA virus sp.]|tara:strand:- start:32013 stop:32177 length:165 start_codon:yes stop_codon:yes gene_type:complete
MTDLRWRWIAAALFVTMIFGAIQHYAGYPALDFFHGFLQSVSAVLAWECAKRAW